MSTTTALTALKKIKKKKSSGGDGLSQEQMVIGAKSLVTPLTNIINQSIKSGINMLSVNQLNAQMKLLDLWKANNCINYPTKIKKMEANEDRSTTRAVTSGKLVESGTSQHAKSTFYNDSVKAWNRALDNIKSCKSIWSAKKAIKSFVKTLPR